MGIDASVENVKVAKAACAGLPLKIDFAAKTTTGTGFWSQLDFVSSQASSFDVIVALEVVEHVNDANVFISDISKLLKVE